MPRGVPRRGYQPWSLPLELRPTRRVWRAMLARVEDDPHYVGVTVCDRWRESFEAFVEDMGLRPEGKSIDRIDNDRGYEPGNCRWATPEEQATNRRRTRFWEHEGVRLTLPQWAKRLGMRTGTLERRVYVMKWPFEKAVTEPVRSS